MTMPTTVARFGIAVPHARPSPTFASTASFAADAVDAALPYLINVLDNVGLDTDPAADLVLVVYEDMRTAARNADTVEIGVDVEVCPGTITVSVHQHTAAPVVADQQASGWGHQRHAATTWVIRTNTADEPLVAVTRLDRAAVFAQLTSASASASALAASVARGAHGFAPTAVTIDPSAPAAARRQVLRTLHANAVSDITQADVGLMVSEVIANVLRYEDSHLVQVEVAVDADRAVTVTVTSATTEPSSSPRTRTACLDDASRGSDRGSGMPASSASARGTRRERDNTATWFTVGDVESTATPGTPAQPDLAASEAVVAEAVAIAAATEAQLTAPPEVVAVHAAIAAEQAARDAAVKTARAAQSARAARAVAATQAADAVAESAARTVEAVQSRADQVAMAVATAASKAAATVSESIAPGGDAEAAQVALRMGATVSATASAKAAETTHTAFLVARAVAAAADAVAATTAAAAAAVEREVLDAASAMRALTTLTAQQLASDTVERAAAVALASAEAAIASTRLHEANVQLRRAGHHDRTVARALQDAMLTQLPESDDLHMAARYLTAAEQDQVGGDWYDAVVLPTGSTTLVIGDVVGHDIAAAAVMGQLRNMLRALLWDRDEPPSAIVARLDRAIRDLRLNTMATMALVSVEQCARRQPAGFSTVRWTNAGHPAPMLIHSDGTAIALEDTTDILLGVRPDTARRDYTHLVPPGATLLLYTDGLIETRAQDADAGQQRLLAALRTHHRLDPDELLDAVIADMVGDQTTDDVAILAVRFQHAH